MKILLINVPFGIKDIGGNKKKFSGVENQIPSLGLAYLGAMSEQEGYDVRIIECCIGLDWKVIEAESKAFHPDVVGISATTPSFDNAIKTVQVLRKTIPKSIFVIGGSQPTAMPELTSIHDLFDFIVIGEGELTFIELLKHINGNGKIIDEIEGLAYKQGGKLHFTPPRKMITNLDSIPFPARHLLPPLKSYHPTPASFRKLPLAHIMTSRGCPSKCNFCDRSIFGESYRARSVQNVILEIEEVVSKYGAKEIRFFDDTFTINRKRLEGICTELKKFRPRIIWTCLTKVNCVDLDMLKMMKESGCWQVLFGLESGDDKILKTLGKKNTVKQNIKAVKWARKAGLKVRADFLVGSPFETLNSLNKTLKLAKELDIDYAHFNKFVPFPGTYFYQQLIKQGYSFDFSKSSTLDHDSLIYIPPGVSEDYYRSFLDNAYKEFYFRPKYLIKKLLSIKTMTEFKANLKGAIAIKFM